MLLEYEDVDMPEQANDQADDHTWKATIGYNRLYEYLKSINSLVDECRLHVDENGILTSAADPANVAIVQAELGADAFDSYQKVDTDIGLNVTRIRRVLEGFDDPDTVTITFKEEYKKMVLDAGDYSFTASCFDTDSIRSDAEFPNLDLAATVEIGNERLDTAVKYFDKFTDKVNVGYDPSEAEFYMEGQGSTDDGEFRLHRQDLVAVPRSGVARSLYHLDYFQDLTGALPEEGTVQLEIGEEYPMCMSYGISALDGPGDRYHGEVKFLQAPRIQSD